jgi:putative sterol carrier protein
MQKFDSIPALLQSYQDRFIPEKAEGVDAVIQLKLSGEAEALYFITIREKTIEVCEGLHEAPVLTVISTIKDWLKLNNGESNPMTLMMMGKLKVEGPLPLVMQFRTMFT